MTNEQKIIHDLIVGACDMLQALRNVRDGLPLRMDNEEDWKKKINDASPLLATIPEPAPSEGGAIDRERVAYGRFAVELWRCVDHPGGMDWIETVARMLQAHDTALRAQLARTDALREALKRIVEWGEARNFDPTCESGKMIRDGRSALLAHPAEGAEAVRDEKAGR